MKWYILIFFPMLIGCQLRNDKINHIRESSINSIQDTITDYRALILNAGNADAYKKLYIQYLDYNYSEEFLVYALIMANKYDYPQAYFDVFICLTEVYLNDLNKLDSTTADMAIEYLIKAYQKEHHQAKDIVEKYSIVYDVNRNKDQIMKIYN